MRLLFKNSHINNNALRIILLSTGSNMIRIIRSKCKMEQKGDHTNTRVIISKRILASSFFYHTAKTFTASLQGYFCSQAAHKETNPKKKEFLHYKVRPVQHSLAIAERSGWTQWSKTFSHGHFH